MVGSDKLGVCRFGGHVFQESTRISKPKFGVSWCGGLTLYAGPGLCPKCYKEREMQGDVVPWTDLEWDLFIGEKIKYAQLEDAQQLVAQLRAHNYERPAAKIENHYIPILVAKKRRQETDAASNRIGDLIESIEKSRMDLRVAGTIETLNERFAQITDAHHLLQSYVHDHVTHAALVETWKEVEIEYHQRKQAIIHEQPERERQKKIAELAIRKEKRARQIDVAEFLIWQFIIGAFKWVIIGFVLSGIMFVGSCCNAAAEGNLAKNPPQYSISMALFFGIFGGVVRALRKLGWAKDRENLWVEDYHDALDLINVIF